LTGLLAIDDESSRFSSLDRFRSPIPNSAPAYNYFMNLDDKVCYCFHISRRKLVNYARIHRLKVPSQLSQCGGAGTGCGWCVPFLKQIFNQSMLGGETDLETLSAEDYERRRAGYIRAGKGKPPTGATPLPVIDEAIPPPDGTPG
jgi:bacterioferritin-associated ferredoxin